jgi:hypothetical protein
MHERRAVGCELWSVGFLGGRGRQGVFSQLPQRAVE